MFVGPEKVALFFKKIICSGTKKIIIEFTAL